MSDMISPGMSEKLLKAEPNTFQSIIFMVIQSNKEIYIWAKDFKFPAEEIYTEQIYPMLHYLDTCISFPKHIKS